MTRNSKDKIKSVDREWKVQALESSGKRDQKGREGKARLEIPRHCGSSTQLTVITHNFMSYQDTSLGFPAGEVLNRIKIAA